MRDGEVLLMDGIASYVLTEEVLRLNEKVDAEQEDAEQVVLRERGEQAVALQGGLFFGGVRHMYVYYVAIRI